MEYKLEIKPYTAENGVKCKIIQITDFTLHTAKKQPTPSIGNKVKEVFDADEPGRIYAPIEAFPKTEGYSLDQKADILERIKKDPEFMKMVAEENRNGYKVLLALPRAGIPVLAGKDTQEFMQSKNGKRIIRGLAKNKPSE